VSPLKTGAGNTMSVQPRFATANWLTSATLMPTTTASVNALFTSGLPNSERAAYASSKWIGC